MIPASVLEKLVSKLLVQEEREALRGSFIELIEEFYQPQSIHVYTSGLRGIVSYRGNNLADLTVRDIMHSDVAPVLLSHDMSLYAAVDLKSLQIVRLNESTIDLYVPLHQGGIVGAVLVLKGLNSDIVEDSVWQNLLQAYNNLNRMLYSAEMDPLTGLMNRLAFDRLVNRQTIDEKQITKESANTYFALVDIDFFKKINDNFGHLYGDEVLILLTRAMSDSFRSVDWLFRYGGEEFAIVLSDVNAQEAHLVLERFRENIASMNFPQVGKVTVSIGFSRMVHIEAASLLVDRADHALYYAKDHGRDQVLCYETLCEQGLLKESVQDEGDIELF